MPAWITEKSNVVILLNKDKIYAVDMKLNSG